jgi:hypothetical protein
MHSDGALPFSRWALLGISIVAGVVWMFAVTYYEKPTLYVTAVSGTYSSAALLWWRRALLDRRWVQMLSVAPLVITAGCLTAFVIWALTLVI